MESEVDRRLSALMHRAQDGDRLAYEAVLVAAGTLVRRYVRTRLHHADLVEDVVQDTLLAIHHHRHTYDAARPFAPWMYAIARHRMLDCVRKQRHRREREVDGSEEGPSATVYQDSRTDLLHAALALLSRAQQEVIQMLKFDGYSVAEVAQKTGRSESSVKVTAHRGYRSLRKLIVSATDDE